MDSELKAKWIAALRSGEFAQSRGRLTGVTASGQPLHCCLAVLCVVKGIPMEPNQKFLTPGHDDPDSLDLSYLQMSQLVDMNDHQCLDFAQIADYIEREL